MNAVQIQLADAVVALINSIGLTHILAKRVWVAKFATKDLTGTTLIAVRPQNETSEQLTRGAVQYDQTIEIFLARKIDASNTAGDELMMDELLTLRASLRDALAENGVELDDGQRYVPIAPPVSQTLYDVDLAEQRQFQSLLQVTYREVR